MQQEPHIYFILASIKYVNKVPCQGHNTLPLDVRLKPETSQFQVKHSTTDCTEQLCC